MEEAEKGEIFERNTVSTLDRHPDPGPTAGLLTDDLILEILSRLPARSLHRVKCVSVSWRDLIIDPANRNKLPQTLAGFLYMTVNSSGCRHHFASISGDGAAPFDPSLQPNKYMDMVQVDACNGLLLYCGCNEKLSPFNWAEDDFRFVVCNPLTGRWVELPPTLQAPENNRYSCTAGLAFDPAAHFNVLHFEQAFHKAYVTGVNIYSSWARAWTRRDSGMVEKVAPFFRGKCVFVSRIMYVMGSLMDMNNEYVLMGVDMEGKVWKTIRVPYGQRFATIGVSQGCLHYAAASVVDNDKRTVSQIALWCLKGRDSKELVLKHTANINKLMSMTGKKYMVDAVHPDCDTIFLISYGGDTLAAYDMRHQKVGCILNLEKSNTCRFLPYVPLFSKSLADADEQ
ncbi:hypothetical protein CFC21_106571 [Triticum aestivum]|uniref:F-box domain-containing protein n=2 Tax=Triticum aestivum TaxID=4565 RepID=A0A9R1MED5_WHEAT|nr:putative F-box protein At4g38870 [Triticum aestivum]KAF7105796.1 hypothetical protein CFC21_106571 [Triticum aestivum]